jgi:peptide/nickel transport system permease protein
MLRAIATRIATALVTLLVVTIVVFALLCALPGDPSDEDGGSRPLPPAYRAALRAQYHLDEPWPARYALWMRDVLRGDLGTSLTAQQPVAMILRARLPVTLGLNSLALLGMLGVAVPLGILGAWKPDGRWDRAGWVTTTALYAMPVFWTALLLQWLFAIRLGWLPLSGVATDGIRRASIGRAFVDTTWHLVLPATCLASGVLAYVSRFVRTSLVESTAGDGGKAARARGLSTLQYVARHGVAQAVVPLLTLAGFLIPRLVGGSLLIEQIFNVPGLGSLLFSSILARDLPVVLALTLLSGVATLLGTTLSDTLILLLDPRVRHAR